MTASSHSRLASSQPFDHLVYLRVFEGCNLHCKHCFIPSNPRRMTLEDIAKVPDLLADRIAPGSTIMLQWHGGEPTLMGPDFIRSGIDLLRKNGADWTWNFGIQTNLMNFDPTWAELYRDHFSGEVGISWDPKIRLLNARAEDSNPIYEQRFFEKLDQLLDSGLTPYMVVTATAELFRSYPNPLDFMHQWHARGVTHIHLERVTPTGYARRNWTQVGLDNAQYSKEMSRWMLAYQRYRTRAPQGYEFHLSPFSDLFESVKSLQEGAPRAQGCWSGKCDTRFHTIDADGYKVGCTALTSEIGNRASNQRLDLGNDLPAKRSERIYSCNSCSFRRICSSGCLALSFDDGSGECSGGYRLFQTAAALNGNFWDLPHSPPTLNDGTPRLK